MQNFKHCEIWGQPKPHHHHQHYLTRDATLKQTNSTLQHTFSKMILNMQPYFYPNWKHTKIQIQNTNSKDKEIKTDPHKIDDKNTNQSVLA